MAAGSTGLWSWVHKWTSLVCTLFLLMLCITGLPLIFHEEIDGLTHSGPVIAPARPGETMLPLDRVIALALAKAPPGQVPLYMSFDEDRPVVNVTTGPKPNAAEAEMRFFPIDRRTGEPVPFAEGGVMDIILQIHKDMFLGLPGMLFLGFMGVVFAVSVVSGIVIYAPYMRKLAFGTVRRERTRWIKWLDYHNLLGITTLAWAIVVGLTGTINTLSEPITAWWRADELAAILPAKDGAAVEPYRPGIAGKAVANALAAAPRMQPQFVAFPGVAFSSNGHLAVFLQGATPATKKLLTPVLADARTGRVDAVAPMPWYMKALLLSQPLHFGDYGGMAMKLLWAALDIVTIVVTGSGVYLWLRKARMAKRAQRARRLVSA